jgi:hypothetical protein
LMTYDSISVSPGEAVEVTGLSCKVIPGDRPTLCPDAHPPLPPSMLSIALRAVRRLHPLPPGTTIHWVGNDTGYRNRCRCHPDAPYAAPFDRDRWAAVVPPAPPSASALPVTVAEPPPANQPATQARSESGPQLVPDPVVEPIVGNEVRSVRDPDPASDFCLWLEGGTYYICGFGEEGRFADLRGFGDLQKLILSPGEPVPWAELDPTILAIESRSAQPAMDTEAIVAARAELNRLREEVDSADNDVDRADSQRRYYELTAQLQGELGPGGRTRDLNSLINKLRPKIAGRLNTVYENLRATEPPLEKLASHFQDSISSSTSGFVYAPKRMSPPWRTEKDRK